MQLLAPMMPHLAEECWRALGAKGLVAEAPWPVLDRSLLVEDAITLPVQVNGKKRADVTVARDADQAAIEAAVLSLDAVRRATGGAAGAQDHRRAAEDRECRRLNAWPAAASGSLAVALAAGAVSACFRPLYGPTASGERLEDVLAAIEVAEGRDARSTASASAITCAASWSSTSTARASRRRSATSSRSRSATSATSPIVDTATGRAVAATLNGDVDLHPDESRRHRDDREGHGQRLGELRPLGAALRRRARRARRRDPGREAPRGADQDAARGGAACRNPDARA